MKLYFEVQYFDNKWGYFTVLFAVAFTYDSSEIIDSFKWNDSVPVSHKWNHNLISIYKILQNILALFKHPNKGPYKYPIYRSTSWQSHFKGPFKYDFHRWKMTNAWVQKHKTKLFQTENRRNEIFGHNHTSEGGLCFHKSTSWRTTISNSTKLPNELKLGYILCKTII